MSAVSLPAVGPLRLVGGIRDGFRRPAVGQPLERDRIPRTVPREPGRDGAIVLEHPHGGMPVEPRVRPRDEGAVGSEPAVGDEEMQARMAMDTMLVPGIRWEMAHYLALSRCASPLAVIRGRPPDADSVLTRLRPVLARTASAQRLWNLLLETPAHMRASLASMDNGEPSVLSNVREGVWASRVLRAPVIEDCTAVVRGAY